MTIEINDKWSIDTGPSNNDFKLIERREGKNRKTGETTITEKETYHPSLEQCIGKIMKSETLTAVDHEGYRTLEDVKSHIDQVQKSIVEALNGNTK